MKKLYFICLVTILTFSAFSQYWMENVTEKSFEKSNLHFNSYYLNPFGFKNFKDVSLGFFDDPFLNLQLNPANLPDLERSTYIYLDFIGEKNNFELPGGIRPMYLEYDYYIPQRFYMPTINDTDPQPFFSLGVLKYPFANKKFLIGGTYQVIYKKEKFYNPIHNIYNWALGYDAFGEKAPESYDLGYPVTDRYAGKDEMLFNGHFFSAFLGYDLNEKVNLGVSMNGVYYAKDGIYESLNQNDYNQPETYNSVYFSGKEKNHEYNHLDLSAGINYKFSEKLSAGLKLGVLQGKTEQFYSSLDTSYYYRDNSPDYFNYSHYYSKTNQSWDQDGNNKYVNFQLTKNIDDENKIKFNYGYSKTDLDITNLTTIFDTSYYAGSWNYDTDSSNYHHHSYLADNRSGIGTKEKYQHRGMLTFDWQVSEKSKILIGALFINRTETIYSNEPVDVLRRSLYYHYHSVYNPESEEVFRRLKEVKTLDWNYEISEKTLQIPIQFQFRANKYWQFMFTVNRIMNDVTVKEQTSAFFERREETKNGETTIRENFIERYTMPVQSLTENKTDVMVGVQLTISPKFSLNLNIDPEINNTVNNNFINIAQWWLSFKASI